MRTRACWLCCGFGVLIISAAGAGPTEPPRLEARLDRVADYLAKERDRQGIPGMSAAVVIDNQPAWSRGFGRADIENDVPATPQTVYRIASISKMITAVAVLQLVQNGRLSLHASVRDYVPELPDKGELITVRHVLAHLAGIRHYRNADEFLSRQPFQRMVDTLDAFKDDPLVAKPGERFVYSTLAYNLLGLVVERVSGESFDDYLDKHVFEPAGMKSSGPDDLRAIIPRRARGYTRRPDEPLRSSAFVDLSGRYPGDGMVSTVEDLARFAAGFNLGKILDPSLVQVMTTAHRTSAGESTKYGLGCFVRELEGRKIIGHAGVVPQAAAFLLIIPADDLAVVLIANLEQADVKTMALNVARLLLGEEVALTTKQVEPPN